MSAEYEFQQALLCPCGNCKLCCITFCCPFVTVYQNSRDAEENAFAMCAMSFFLPCGMPICQGKIRKKIREIQNIGGNFCFDFLAVLLCPCCALIQMAFELKSIAVEKQLAGKLGENEANDEEKPAEVKSDPVGPKVSDKKNSIQKNTNAVAPAPTPSSYTIVRA